MSEEHGIIIVTGSNARIGDSVMRVNPAPPRRWMEGSCLTHLAGVVF